MVNVQSSSWNSADRARCVINLAVAPEPWLRWQRAKLGAGMPTAVSESLGLYRKRLHPSSAPTGVDVWWEVTDEGSAFEAAQAMVVGLEANGWPLLKRLLTRDGMLSQIRSGDLGDMRRTSLGVFFAMAEALMLMDEGPSSALDEQLGFAISNGMPTQAENARRFDEWVREQARRATRR